MSEETENKENQSDYGKRGFREILDIQQQEDRNR